MSNGVSTIKKKLKYTETPDDIEEFIVSWINNICQSLKVIKNTFCIKLFALKERKIIFKSFRFSKFFKVFYLT